MELFALHGRHVRLEPLARHHIDGLLSAADADRSLYGWTVVPETRDSMAAYVDAAIASREAGVSVPFATLRADRGAIIGSTRFFDIGYWAWPDGHPASGRGLPDVCEIGYTWLTRPAIRTPANTEAKLLMLTHAFETWNVLRVCLHTDERNERSRAAIARIGGQFEGILRAHKMASDNTPRNSARFSILAAEWPRVKQRLQQMLDGSL
jgi:RimJ/RimL family protein N-acetyltransferase